MPPRPAPGIRRRLSHAAATLLPLSCGAEHDPDSEGASALDHSDSGQPTSGTEARASTPGWLRGPDSDPIGEFTGSDGPAPSGNAPAPRRGRPARQRPSGPRTTAKSKAVALIAFLRDDAAPLFSDRRCVAASAIMRQIEAGRLPRLSSVKSADALWQLAAADPAHFEVMLERGVQSIRAIGKHRGEAHFTKCSTPLPLVITSRRSPRTSIYPCTEAVGEDILARGWRIKEHAGTLPYIKFIEADIATALGGSGVALRAQHATKDRMVLLRRADGSFYTNGMGGIIDPWFARPWPPGAIDSISCDRRPFPPRGRPAPPHGTVQRRAHSLQGRGRHR